MKATTTIFLHGLDSSSRGTKGIFFLSHFPHVIRPDFDGDLDNRLLQLEKICAGKNDITFIGTSFGGLMATCFALKFPSRVTRLILLAPALNFKDYQVPDMMLPTETFLVIGKHDTVTPADLVVPLAEKTFSNIKIAIEDDDHMLHGCFKLLDWDYMIGKN